MNVDHVMKAIRITRALGFPMAIVGPQLYWSDKVMPLLAGLENIDLEHSWSADELPSECRQVAERMDDIDKKLFWLCYQLLLRGELHVLKPLVDDHPDCHRELAHLFK